MRLRKTREGVEVGLLFTGIIVAHLLGSLSGLPSSMVDLEPVAAGNRRCGGSVGRSGSSAADLRC
jgi:hypothetical protein